MSRRGAGTTGASVRSLSSGSITPMEDEDEAPKRSTRGRNPLPPTSGPLFPPLPPKVVKPKVSKSPNPTATASGSGSASRNQSQLDDGEVEAEPEVNLAGESAQSPGRAIPSGSGGSLSPPPGDGEDATSGRAQKGPASRRKGKSISARQSVDIKVEDEPTLPSGPNGNGNGASNGTNSKTRRYSSHLAPPEPASAGESESDAGAGKARNRRRRGEDQLLFDDHLLPEELRRTGKITGKRARESNTSAASEGGRSSKRRNSSFRRDEEDEEVLMDDGKEDASRGSGAPMAGKEEVPADEPNDVEDGGETGGKEEQGTDADISEPPPEVQQPETTVDANDNAQDAGVTGAEEEEDEKLAQDANGDVAEDGEAELEEGDEGDGEGEDDEGGEEVTRCVCQREDGDPLMISCETCMVWQHMPCVGIWSDPESPDEYFCEKCRPDLHGPLKKWIRQRGRNIDNFLPPSPDDLKSLWSSHDKYPPSQSKRWLTPPAVKKGKKDDKVKEKDKENHREKAKDTEKEKEKIKEEKDKGRGKDASPERRRSTAIAREVPDVARERPESGRQASRRPSSHGPPSQGHAYARPVSITVDAPSPNNIRDSQSPMNAHREPKRRSTMNSRDAAIEEEEMRRAMEESRREIRDEGEEGEAVPPVEGVMVEKDKDVVEEEAREPEEEHGERAGEGERARREKGKGKARREEEPSPAPNKPKHPNQYTYRPKPSGPVITPARRGGQGGTPAPAPAGPALHDHGTRRAGALANGAREAPFVAVQSDGLGWNIPDHLAHYASLLPSPSPVLLSVRSPRPMANLAKSHFLNYKYGPFSNTRDPTTGRLVMPTDGPERDVVGEKGETHTENPAKPKWPPRRMTTAEMRKRVRGMLEFVGKVQLDEDKRGQRRRGLGIPEYDYEAAREGSKRRKLDVAAGAPGMQSRGKGKSKEKEQEQGTLAPAAAAEGQLERGDDLDVDMEAEPSAQVAASGQVESAEGAGDDTHLPNAQEEPDESVDDLSPPSPPLKTMTSGPPLSQLLAELMAELVEFEDTYMRPGGVPPTKVNGSPLGLSVESGVAGQSAPAAAEDGSAGSGEVSGPGTTSTGAAEGGVSGAGSAVPSEQGISPKEVAEPTSELLLDQPAEAPTAEAGDSQALAEAGGGTQSETIDPQAVEESQPTANPEQTPTAIADRSNGSGSSVKVPATGATTEHTDDPLDVYRVGKVDTVVTEPEEQVAADIIAREAASTLGEEGPAPVENAVADATAGQESVMDPAAEGSTSESVPQDSLIPLDIADPAPSLTDLSLPPLDASLTDTLDATVSSAHQDSTAAETPLAEIVADASLPNTVENGAITQGLNDLLPTNPATLPSTVPDAEALSAPISDPSLVIPPMQSAADAPIPADFQLPDTSSLPDDVDVDWTPDPPTDLNLDIDMSMAMGMGVDMGTGLDLDLDLTAEQLAELANMPLPAMPMNGDLLAGLSELDSNFGTTVPPEVQVPAEIPTDAQLQLDSGAGGVDVGLDPPLGTIADPALDPSIGALPLGTEGIPPNVNQAPLDVNVVPSLDADSAAGLSTTAEVPDADATTIS